MGSHLFPHHHPLSKEVRAGVQARNLEAGTKAELTEDAGYSLASQAYSACFLIQPRTACPALAPPSELGPLTSIINQENALYTYVFVYRPILWRCCLN